MSPETEHKADAFMIQSLERRLKALEEVMNLQHSLIKGFNKRLLIMWLSGALAGAFGMRLFLLGVGV